MPSLPASAGSSTSARAACAASGQPPTDTADRRGTPPVHSPDAPPSDRGVQAHSRASRKGLYLAVRLHGTLPHGASSFSLVRRGTMIVGHTE